MASIQTSQPSQLPCAKKAPSTIAPHGWLTILASTRLVHTPIREGESEGVSFFRYDEGSSADARPSDVWILSFIIHTQLSLKFESNGKSNVVIPSSLMPYCAAVSQHPKVHQEIHAAGSGSLCHRHSHPSAASNAV